MLWTQKSSNSTTEIVDDVTNLYMLLVAMFPRTKDQYLIELCAIQ